MIGYYVWVGNPTSGKHAKKYTPEKSIKLTVIEFGNLYYIFSVRCTTKKQQLVPWEKVTKQSKENLRRARYLVASYAS